MGSDRGWSLRRSVPSRVWRWGWGLSRSTARGGAAAANQRIGRRAGLSRCRCRRRRGHRGRIQDHRVTKILIGRRTERRADRHGSEAQQEACRARGHEEKQGPQRTGWASHDISIRLLREAKMRSGTWQGGMGGRAARSREPASKAGAQPGPGRRSVPHLRPPVLPRTLIHQPILASQITSGRTVSRHVPGLLPVMTANSALPDGFASPDEPSQPAFAGLAQACEQDEELTQT